MFVVITKPPSKVEEDIVEGLYHNISVQCARKNTYAFAWLLCKENHVMHQYRWSDKGLLLKFSTRLLNDLYTHFPRQTAIQGLVHDIKNINLWWLFNKVKPVLLVNTPRWSTICTIYNQYENVLHILFGSRSYKTGSHWCFGVCLETSFNLKTRKLVSIMARAVL